MPVVGLRAVLRDDERSTGRSRNSLLHIIRARPLLVGGGVPDCGRDALRFRRRR